MELEKPEEPSLEKFQLTAEKVEQIEKAIDSIDNRTYYSTYIPSTLFILFLMAVCVAITGQGGPAIAGLLIGLGISDGWSEKLSNRIKEKKRSKIVGYKSLTNYKYAKSSYEYKLRDYNAKIEAAKEKKEKEKKRKEYDYWMSIDPWDFENEIAELFSANGYRAKVTKGSGDGGIDIFLDKNGRKGIVQCKRFKTKVGPGPVRDLYGTMIDGKFKYGFLVCPSGFSDNAFTFSKNKNITLIGLKRIIEMTENNA
jgi:uncharacterized membrane protein